MLKSLQKFDVFSKTVDELRVKTFAGGFLSLCSCLIIVFLSLAEFNYYLRVQRSDRLMVDPGSTERLEVYVNITFLAISCDALTIDIMDVSGAHQEDAEHLFFKQRLTLDGRPINTPEKGDIGKGEQLMEEEDSLDEETKAKLKSYHEKLKDPDYCGSCYTGQAEKCCNTCDEVEQAYMDLGWAFRLDDRVEQCIERAIKKKMKYSAKEGCRIEGDFLVKKVAGNFHFAPGKSSHSVLQHVHEYSSFEVDNFNTSHILHSLGFGKKYPGLTNPLDGTVKICDKFSGLYQYFIKVVPTDYNYYGGYAPVKTNQYAVTEHFRERKPGSNVVPGLYFLYDLSPIMVVIQEQRQSFFRLLTSLCAILGGVLVSSQMLDGLIYFIMKKEEKGRNTIIK